jgi:hypothetical protein
LLLVHHTLSQQQHPVAVLGSAKPAAAAAASVCLAAAGVPVQNVQGQQVLQGLQGLQGLHHTHLGCLLATGASLVVGQPCECSASQVCGLQVWHQLLRLQHALLLLLLLRLEPLVSPVVWLGLCCGVWA